MLAREKQSNHCKTHTSHAGSRYFNPQLKFIRHAIPRPARWKRPRLNPRAVHVGFPVKRLVLGETSFECISKFHILPSYLQRCMIASASHLPNTNSILGEVLPLILHLPDLE
jgi:hypothetical protein